MKRPTTKFKATVPKYEDGGFFAQKTTAPGYAMAASGIGSVFNQVAPTNVDPRFAEDKQYQQDIAKAQQPSIRDGCRTWSERRYGARSCS